MSNSADVSAGDNITAAQINNLRADILNITTGHSHNGVDSKSITATYANMQIKIQVGSASGASGTVTFAVAFSSTPNVVAHENTNNISYVRVYDITTSSFKYAGANTSITWIAKGA
jgi:hypothetical protein